MEAKNLIELIKITVDKNKESSDDDKDNDTILYYDKYSKKLFDVDENGIRIYNRKAKNLKENLLINIPKESLVSIAIDKELKYILCLLIKNLNQKSDQKSDKIDIKKQLILINIAKKKLFDKIDDDFRYLLGIFFIGKILNLKNFDINNTVNNVNDFCNVFCDRVIFYGIEKKSNGGEYIKKLSTINISGNLLITNFSFDYKHKILCLVYSDMSISFLILTNRKNYKNLIKVKLYYVENSTFMGMFRNVGDEQKKMIKDIFDNLDIYTQTQFYLETIYNELYLICLCYEDKKIYLHKLENLNNLENYKKIDYDKHSHFSALQVIDNLIIMHNFLTKIIVVIDIKSKIPIISSFYFDFPYQNNLHINGEILEERIVFSKKNLISINGGNLYNIKFNEKVYDEMAEKDLKEKNEKKKELNDQKNRMMQKKKREMNIYDILMNILHRKGTNNLILNILYKLILNNEANPLHIIKFFKEIISLENTAIEKIEVISDKKLQKKELSESNLPYEVPKPFNIAAAKKNYIQQIDILRNLFAKFGNESSETQNSGNNQENKENNQINKDIDDDLIIRVIFYMIQFAKEINYRKIELKPGFYSIILNYMKMLKEKERLIYFIKHETIPVNPEIGKYLIEISFENQTKYKAIFEEAGFSILERTKSFLLIIDCLFKKGDIARAMNYLHENASKLNYQEIKIILTNNKNIIEKNKELFMKYAG